MSTHFSAPHWSANHSNLHARVHRDRDVLYVLLFTGVPILCDSAVLV
jgi:hypothetical protein